MIFQHQNLTVVEGQLTPIRRALSNWKNIWIAYCTHGQPTALLADHGVSAMWKRIGFFRHCAEYWLLATLLVARISAAYSQPQEIGLPDTPYTGGDDEVPCHARVVEPVLEKYDQTSMQQVNELITGFGSFRL